MKPASLRALVAPASLLLTLGLVGAVGQAQVREGSPDRAIGDYDFRLHDIAMPAGYEDLPKKSVRTVNPAYQHIQSWISSVGASVATTDIAHTGRASALCIVDPRTDRVTLTYAPTAPTADKFKPFYLGPGDLPYNSSSTAPMGCAPGDFNGDGNMDLLIYYWGRTPILKIARGPVSRPSAADYRTVELVPTGSGKIYTGQPWNTNAVSIDDFNGDNRADILIGNYFPESSVLGRSGRKDVEMNDSMSDARNGGGQRALRWTSNAKDGTPRFEEDQDAVPYSSATGWTLATASTDLDDDGLPEAYIANDFGHDHLLRNVSTRGREIKFTTAVGTRTPTTPKSFVLGKDSFKGMGADFVDLSGRGRSDILVSNITSSWGLEESNYVWQNDATSPKAMRRELAAGRAPFTQVAQQHGLAWGGWAWDIKAADFANMGTPAVVQAAGFVKGDRNRVRWAWLQELATANDVLLQKPDMWPNVKPGDDLSGDQKLGFFAPTDTKYTNVNSEVGITGDKPTRGIAPGDTTGTGRLDFAVAVQWGAPQFYENTSPNRGTGVTLRLRRPALPAPGGQQDTVAYGASVTLKRADGTTSRMSVDGGSGHGGKRDQSVHFGLGSQKTGSFQVSWRDSSGKKHVSDLRLGEGRHTILLDANAKVVK